MNFEQRKYQKNDIMNNIKIKDKVCPYLQARVYCYISPVAPPLSLIDRRLIRYPIVTAVREIIRENSRY